MIYNCFRFLPTSTTSATTDARFVTGTSSTVTTYTNILGTAANGKYLAYTQTQPTPVTKSAMSLLSSVAVAIGALAML